MFVSVRNWHQEIGSQEIPIYDGLFLFYFQFYRKSKIISLIALVIVTFTMYSLQWNDNEQQNLNTHILVKKLQC